MFPSSESRPATLAQTSAPEASDRGELFALTRALVFTKEAYRSLRARSRPAAAATPPTVAMARGIEALTPWDLMDDDVAETGITFTFFQRRTEPAAAVRGA